MKTSFFGKLALLAVGCCLASAGTAQASIEAFSNLLIENAGVYNYTGGVKGAAITDLTEIIVVSAAHSATANADVTSIPGASSTTIGPLATAAGLDTLQASQGPSPGQNTFNNVVLGDPHAYADTAGVGSLVAPGGGVVTDPFGVRASTVGSVNLVDLPTSTDAGSADATNGVTAAFLVTNNGSPLDILIELDAFVEQFIDLAPSPPGAAASVDNSWTFSVTDAVAGSQIFSWSPDGSAGGISGGIEINDPFNINGGISGFPGVTTGPVVNKTSGFAAIDGGVAGVGGDPAAFAASFTLPVGQFSLVIQHSSAAQAITQGVADIPEPTSCIAWALLSLCGGAGVYVRRRCSKQA